MNEEYTFEEKKRAVRKYLSTVQQREHNTTVIGPFELKQKSDYCLYCERVSDYLKKNPEKLYCSSICGEIGESNNGMDNTKNRKFIPFELLSTESQEEYRKLMETMSDDYDRVLIRHTINTESLLEQTVTLYITIVKKLEIISETVITFRLEQKSNPLPETYELKNLPDIIQGDHTNKNFKQYCLFCKTSIDNQKNTNLLQIDQNIALGFVCSFFCSKAFLSYVEPVVKPRYKNFISVPHPNIIKNFHQLNYLKRTISKNIIMNTSMLSQYSFVLNIISYMD